MANNNFNSPGNMMGHMSEVFDFFQKFPANTENKNEDTTGSLVKMADTMISMPILQNLKMKMAILC